MMDKWYRQLFRWVLSSKQEPSWSGLLEGHSGWNCGLCMGVERIRDRLRWLRRWWRTGRNLEFLEDLCGCVMAGGVSGAGLQV